MSVSRETAWRKFSDPLFHVERFFTGSPRLPSTTSRLPWLSSSGNVALHDSGGIRVPGASAPEPALKRKSSPPGRMNACRFIRTELSIRTARNVSKFMRFVQRRSRQQPFKARGDHLRIRHLERPHRLPKKHRLARLCLDEQEPRRGQRERQRNRRRAAAAPDVDHPRDRRCDVLRRNERLNQ